jgi:hypothetical protein
MISKVVMTYTTLKVHRDLFFKIVCAAFENEFPEYDWDATFIYEIDYDPMDKEYSFLYEKKETGRMLEVPKPIEVVDNDF